MDPNPPIPQFCEEYFSTGGSSASWTIVGGVLALITFIALFGFLFWSRYHWRARAETLEAEWRRVGRGGMLGET
jgi:hypothetical protein